MIHLIIQHIEDMKNCLGINFDSWKPKVNELARRINELLQTDYGTRNNFCLYVMMYVAM